MNMGKMKEFTPPNCVKKTKNKLSVITINYNNRDGLLRTIKSVVGQTCHDFEYIVIDGGSTDGSVEVIKEYADYIDYWVSEPDKGIYNAMNKGVRAAHGEFSQFLNSGDWYESNIVIDSVLCYLSKDVDILTGYTWCVSQDGKYIKWKDGSPKYLTAVGLMITSLAHPSSFIRTRYLKDRPYDETLKIVSDWKFFFESYIEGGFRYRHIDLDVAIFDRTGISSLNYELAKTESNKTRDLVIHPKIFNNIASLPPEICHYFSIIPENARSFRRLLVGIIYCIIRLYLFIRRIQYPNILYIKKRNICHENKKSFRCLYNQQMCK